MGKDKRPKKRRPPDMTEADIALEVDGDIRLLRLGIDPDGDPADI